MAEPRAAVSLEAMLFDLDGTLVDTAPDMVHALNDVCRRRSVAPPDYEASRAAVSNGGLGMLRLALPDYDDSTLRTTLLPEFLITYERRIAHGSRVFDGLGDLLQRLDERNLPWGIVTNKPIALTRLLVDALELGSRCGVVLGGDSLAERKPHPEPLRYAARTLGVDPARCVYVGDNQRDIESGRRAGMTTVAAAWGYILPGDEPAAWRPDLIMATPGALGDWFERFASAA